MTGHSHSLRVFLALAVTFGAVAESHATPPPDNRSVLILDPTVTGGIGSLEARAAAALGLTPVVVDAATWGATTAAEFAAYRAIVLGDPTCVADVAPLAPAEANRTVWSPAITGNLIIIGSDPTFHAPGVPGAAILISTGIGFAAANVGKPGAYITLSCYYGDAVAGTPVPLLDQFGTFKVVGGPGCPDRSHIVAVHPALAGLTDADLSQWGCSTHEGFVHPDGTPPGFLALALSLDIASSFVAADGTTGAPYIVARGEDLSPVLCGNGSLDTGEQCDDGNTVNGDLCTAQCKLPEATPVVPKTPPLCNAGCKLRIKCNSATGCRNQTFLLAPSKALRLSDEGLAKAKGPIAFAKSSVTNIPPGGSKRVTLRLTAKGRDFVKKTKKERLTVFIEIRNTAGSAVSNTPFKIRLKK